MGAREEALDFLKRLNKAEVEVFVWKGTVRIDPGYSLSKATESELTRLKPQILRELVVKAEQERTKPRLVHKWLLKRGRKAHGRTVPGYLACGSQTWAMNCIRAATLFSVDGIERSLWTIIEHEWIGQIKRRDDGVLIATELKFPENFEAAAPDGVNVEITSACNPCIERSEPEQDTEKVVKDEG